MPVLGDSQFCWLPGSGHDVDARPRIRLVGQPWSRLSPLSRAQLPGGNGVNVGGLVVMRQKRHYRLTNCVKGGRVSRRFFFAALAATNLGLLLSTVACYPIAAEYTESEAPKTLRLDNATTQFNFRFAPGSTRLLGGDASRLRNLAATGTIGRASRRCC